MTYADDVQTVKNTDQSGNEPGQTDCDVTAHECSPRRKVFVENGNTDGWIATDTTVALLR